MSLIRLSDKLQFVDKDRTHDKLKFVGPRKLSDN